MGAFREHENGLLIPDHGRAAIVIANNAERGCMDPRTPLNHLSDAEFIRHRPHEGDGEIRNGGAAIGMVIALLGTVEDLDAREAVRLVYGYERSQGRYFEMHQDDNHHQDATQEGLGCAHFDQASDPANAIYYGVKSSRVRDIQDIVFEMASKGEIVVEDPVLTGDHREDGLLVVKSRLHTVVPSTDHTVFFRIDRTRHEDSLKGLAAFAKTRGVNVDTDRLLQVSAQQERTTLGLVTEGKPIFVAKIGSRDSSVKHVGNVRPPQRPRYF
jgi:hypothetical protein